MLSSSTAVTITAWKVTNTPGQTPPTPIAPQALVNIRQCTTLWSHEDCLTSHNSAVACFRSIHRVLGLLGKEVGPPNVLIDPLKMLLQTAVSHMMWILGTKLRCLRKVARATSPATINTLLGYVCSGQHQQAVSLAFVQWHGLLLSCENSKHHENRSNRLRWSIRHAWESYEVLTPYLKHL